MRKNAIHHKPSTADMLKRQLARTRGNPHTVDGEFAQAIGQRLEERRITKVPELPEEHAEPDWWDLAIEHDRRAKELQAQRQAEQEAQNAPQTTANLVMGEIAKAATNSNSLHIPLNGAGVLRAALAGRYGTVNGGRGDGSLLTRARRPLVDYRARRRYSDDGHACVMLSRNTSRKCCEIVNDPVGGSAEIVAASDPEPRSGESVVGIAVGAPRIRSMTR